MLGSPASGLVVLALLLLVLATLDGCLAVLTDANFKAAVAQCVGALDGSLHEGHFVAGEDPVAGNCHGSEYGPISGWDVSRVTDMAGLFAHASSFNGNLESWDVSRVETMEAMFALASSFNGNLENWDVSRVRTMQDMFRGDKHSDYGASSFNGNLENWNVSRLETMENMFKYACAFNGNMERWDVSRVRSMDSVFEHALSFNGDLRAWNTMAVTTFEEMFEDTAIAYEMPWNTDGKNTDGMYEGSCVSGNTANCRESCDHVCRLATKTHCTQDFCLCRPWNSSTNETHGTCQPRETYAGTCVGVEPEPQAPPTSGGGPALPASCASFPEFTIYSDIVNQACCSEGAACPPRSPIPTFCTADCAAVLLPMQATCANFLALVGLSATVDAAVANCPAECPADTRSEECVTADREAVAEALCREWGFHWDAAGKTCTAGGH